MPPCAPALSSLRPVLLTVTTVVGLLPMVMQWNIDLLNQHFTVGAPLHSGGTQLSTAIIAGGLDLCHGTDTDSDTLFIGFGEKTPSEASPVTRGRRKPSFSICLISLYPIG